MASRFKCTSPTLPASELPPEGQEFFTAYADKYGDKSPDPYSIYGYEAMQLALDAIERSGTGEKADVLKALFATKDRESVARHVLDRRQRRHDADRDGARKAVEDGS